MLPVRRSQSPLEYISSGFSYIRYHELAGFMADGFTLCPADIKRVYLYISFGGGTNTRLDFVGKAIYTGGWLPNNSNQEWEFSLDKHFNLVQESWRVIDIPVSNPYVVGIVKNT